MDAYYGTSNGWTQLGGMSSAGGYDLIVGLIQSNVRGAATDYTTEQAVYPSTVDMWQWSLNGVVAAHEPTSHLDVGATGGMGIGNSFVKDYAAGTLAPGRRILYVNAAHGGTGFTTPGSNSKGVGYCWNRMATNNEMNLALRTVENLQGIMASLPTGSRIVAYIANHGSTDGTNNTPKATFKAYLQDWITWLRGQMATPATPYLMMQMRPNLVANETRHRIIDEAQIETANEMNMVGYRTSPSGSGYYMQDVVHFNASGVTEIGHRLYDEYIEMTGGAL